MIAAQRDGKLTGLEHLLHRGAELFAGGADLQQMLLPFVGGCLLIRLDREIAEVAHFVSQFDDPCFETSNTQHRRAQLDSGHVCPVTERHADDAYLASGIGHGTTSLDFSMTIFTASSGVRARWIAATSASLTTR